MRRRPIAFAVRPAVSAWLALLLTTATALGLIGVSGNLDAFSTALGTLHATLQPAADGGDKAAKKQIKAIIKLDVLLAKPATSASYAGEMKAAAKAAKSVAGKLASEATLVAALDDAAVAYRADLQTARDDYAATLGSLTGKALKAAQKKLAKVDSKLAAADAAPTQAKQFTNLAAAAKLLAASPGGSSGGGGGSPVALAIDASGSFLYVAEQGDELTQTSDGDVRQMAIAPDGSVSDLATPALVSVLYPTAIVAHPSLDFVYVGGHGTDGIAQYSIGVDGQLAPLTPAFAAMPGDAAIAALGIDPSGTWLYALGTVFNGSPVVCYRIEADGTLTQLGHDFAAPWGVSMTIAPDGMHVWTSTSYDNGFTLKPEIRSFGNDGVGGVSWIASFGSPAYYFGLVVSPSGGVVYAVHYIPSGGGDVKAFAVGVNGALAEFGTPPATGDYPNAIAITDEGNWLYVANRDDNTISQYAVNGDDTLSALNPATATATHPSALRISPDGLYLFATNYDGTGAAGNLVTTRVIGANGKLTAP
jgi:6-phosphogluconolactonase (cycloisomerase 2 family)